MGREAGAGRAAGGGKATPGQVQGCRASGRGRGGGTVRFRASAGRGAGLEPSPSAASLSANGSGRSGRSPSESRIPTGPITVPAPELSDATAARLEGAAHAVIGVSACRFGSDFAGGSASPPFTMPATGCHPARHCRWNLPKCELNAIRSGAFPGLRYQSASPAPIRVAGTEFAEWYRRGRPRARSLVPPLPSEPSAFFFRGPAPPGVITSRACGTAMGDFGTGRGAIWPPGSGHRFADTCRRGPGRAAFRIVSRCDPRGPPARVETPTMRLTRVPLRTTL